MFCYHNCDSTSIRKSVVECFHILLLLTNLATFHLHSGKSIFMAIIIFAAFSPIFLNKIHKSLFHIYFVPSRIVIQNPIGWQKWSEHSSILSDFYVRGNLFFVDESTIYIFCSVGELSRPCQARKSIGQCMAKAKQMATLPIQLLHPC